MVWVINICVSSIYRTQIQFHESKMGGGVDGKGNTGLIPIVAQNIYTPTLSQPDFGSLLSSYCTLLLYPVPKDLRKSFGWAECPQTHTLSPTLTAYTNVAL